MEDGEVAHSCNPRNLARISRALLFFAQRQPRGLVLTYSIGKSSPILRMVR